MQPVAPDCPPLVPHPVQLQQEQAKPRAYVHPQGKMMLLEVDFYLEQQMSRKRVQR
jgi:hypothetical protein